METVRQHFHRCGIELTDEQEAEIIRLDNEYAAIGFPGFAYHVAGIMSLGGMPKYLRVERERGD